MAVHASRLYQRKDYYIGRELMTEIYNKKA